MHRPREPAPVIGGQVEAFGVEAPAFQVRLELFFDEVGGVRLLRLRAVRETATHPRADRKPAEAEAAYRRRLEHTALAA